LVIFIAKKAAKLRRAKLKNILNFIALVCELSVVTLIFARAGNDFVEYLVGVHCSYALSFMPRSANILQ
jgi:hypothetical protein